MNRLHRLSFEIGWILAGQVAAVAGSLALLRVLTENLSTAEYGVLALALTASGLINQVMTGAVSAGVVRHYSVAIEAGQLHAYLAGTRRMVALCSLVILLAGMIIMGAIALADSTQWLPIVGGALAFALIAGWNATLNGIQTAARQRPVVAFHLGLEAWLRVAFAAALLISFQGAAALVLLAYCLSTAVVTLSQLVFIRRTLPDGARAGQDHGPWMRRIWGFAWPFSFWGLPTWAQQSSDRWSLQAFGTINQVGAYAVLFQLSYTPISMLLNMAMTFLAPILYQRSGDASDPQRNANVGTLSWRIAALGLSLTAMAALVAWLLHRPLFAILVAEEYRLVSYLMPWVVIAGGLYAVGQMLSLRLMSEFRTRNLLFPKIATAFLGIAANILGAAFYGERGVAFALVVFSSVYLIWIFILIILQDKSENEKIYR